MWSKKGLVASWSGSQDRLTITIADIRDVSETYKKKSFQKMAKYSAIHPPLWILTSKIMIYFVMDEKTSK